MYSQKINSVLLVLQQGNIVDVSADAIVNAANASLSGGGGVDGAIHRAGGPTIMEECRKIGGCKTGSAVATSAGNLHAKFIFHAVGPIYDAHEPSRSSTLLINAYASCLNLAEQYNCQSIAFPSLSTGAYRYPLSDAAPIALRTIVAHSLKPTNLRQVFFVLYGQDAYNAFERALKKVFPS